MPGAVFAPFHHGSWDLDELTSVSRSDQSRQASELTMTVWDPVSKQPYFRTAACRDTKIANAHGPAPAPTTSPFLDRTLHYPNDPSLGTDRPAPTSTMAGTVAGRSVP